jgi:precorrin-6B methylase 2
MPKPEDPMMNIDFAGLYRRQWDRSSFGPRGAADWDRRASDRHRTLQIGDYEQAFLQRMNLEDARTVLDIGCGTGNLAVPLALKVRQVYALDFSRQMLRFLRFNARNAGVRNIRVFRRSWSDSWKGVPVADVSICSRAMGVRDIRAALIKMTRHARKRCYATVCTQGMYLSADVAERLGRQITPRPDYIYAVNLLYQLGYHARVDFIRSPGSRAYGNEDEFVEAVRWRVGRLSGAEDKRLRDFFKTLPVNRRGERVHAHAFDWAFLSWECAR